MAQLGPTLVSVLHFERNSDATRRCPPRRVENMGGDGAHGRVQFTKEVAANYEEVSNFFNRSSVILLCSAAAMGSSASRSCWSRSRRAASISSEVLPVAQMMKMKPNFCS